MSTPDQSLPILLHREQIANLITQNQTVVICGETGSGKSTQLPKLCLELGRGKKQIIGHTQPRRIAARSVAARIAEELQTPLGTTVGYKIRFQDQTAPETRIKLMTDGILLAESQNDRLFRRYDTIIIDEAHERSLNIDFLLGMMKRVLPKRPDLKLIITSATIDATRFAQHFADQHGKPAPIIEVAGRTFPIEIFYRPLTENNEYDEDDDNTPDIYDAVKKAVAECVEIDHGDILIFMPTERDILETAKRLRAANLPTRERKHEILPLYARLSTKEQQRIFQKSPHRKIVIATNVAESSLTVPGIRFVIDTGTARISRYSGRTKTQRLPIEPISQSSADQRAGRCGRVGDGICFRLYEKSDYEKRPRYTTPEIQRTNLASVILQTLSLKLGAIERFPFLDPPQSQAIKDGYKTLREIGAIDNQENLTTLGIRLAKLPVDPRIGRMILAAEEENCLADMLVIAAALEIQDPRERPFEQREKADTAHEKFANPESDFLAYLNLWNFYQHLKSTLSQSQLRKACTQNFINYNRMKEWSDIHVQLLSIWHETKTDNPRITTQNAQPKNVQSQNDNAANDSLNRSILTGFLSGIANRDDSENNEYNAAGGGKFLIWPGSGMVRQKKKHKWIVAVERVETTRRYLRTAARIDPAWIEPIAEHLLQRIITEPHWNSETGYVHAYEKVTLFGLTIIPKRRVNFGTLRPLEAREIFIQAALVDGDFSSTLPFVVANENLLNEVIELQDKFRRPDLLTDPSARYEFYNQNLPQEVYDSRSLEKFWKTASDKQRQTLYMNINLLCRLPVDQLALDSFPNKLQTIVGDFPLNYKYEPGKQDDGITVTVSRETLPQLNPTQLSWLVPGMLEEKITTLLRNLPKEVRRQIVPIPDTVKKILPEFIDRAAISRETLETKLAVIITRVAGRKVTAADFADAQLPTELKMNIRVVDGQGKTIKESRDLKELKNELQIQTSNTLPDTTDPRWNRDNVTTFDFDTLPESIECERNGFKIRAYPTLAVQPETKTVSLRLCDNLETANKLTIESLIRFFHQHKKSEIETQIRWLPNVEKLKTYATQLTTQQAKFNLKQDIGQLIANRAVEPEKVKIPRTKEEYKTFLTTAAKKLPNAVTEITKLLEPLLTSYHQAKLSIENLANKFQSTKEDAIQNLENLTPENFLQTTNWQQLQNYPRYFKAIPIRLEKLTTGGLTHDNEATKELQRLQDRYKKIKSEHPTNPELETLRWMLEEYRVSLFAQQLGTQIKISAQRIEKQFEKV